MHDVRRLPVGEHEEITLTLDDLAREGARRMIAAALEAEVQEYVAAFTDEVDEDGKRFVVRNGRAEQRKLTVGSGTIAIRAPRVNDKRVNEDGEREKFSSKILPAYARRSPKVTDVLPVLYLRGLSTGDFGPALAADELGRVHPAIAEVAHHDGPGLGALAVAVLDRQQFLDAVLSDADHDQQADGALGAWAALRDVFPTARRQQCWVHKTANVLDALPKRLQADAKKLLHEMAEAPSRADAVSGCERSGRLGRGGGRAGWGGRSARLGALSGDVAFDGHGECARAAGGHRGAAT
jgi:putative transposase